MKGFAIGTYIGAIAAVCYMLWLHLYQAHYWTTSEGLFCYTMFMLSCGSVGLLIDSMWDDR